MRFPSRLSIAIASAVAMIALARVPSCLGPGGNTVANAVLSVTQSTQPGGTVTVLSGKAGGGGGGLDLLGLLGLAVLAALRLLRSGQRLSLPLLVLCAPAGAQDLNFDIDHIYLGVRAGQSTYSVDSGCIDSALAGDDAAVTSLDRHKTIGVLYTGVPFYGWLSAELGYADLGVYRVGLQTVNPNVARVAVDAVGALKPAGGGITLGIGGPLPLGAGLRSNRI